MIGPKKNSRHSLNQSDANVSQSRLGHSRFPALLSICRFLSSHWFFRVLYCDWPSWLQCFLYFVTLNRKGQWFISTEETHMTFVYESAEISSFLMFMISRLLVAFI